MQIRKAPLGHYSLSKRMSYRKISGNLKATKFGIRLCFEVWQESSAEMPVKFQSDAITTTSNLSKSRLHDILRQDVHLVNWGLDSVCFSSQVSCAVCIHGKIPSRRDWNYWHNACDISTIYSAFVMFSLSRNSTRYFTEWWLQISDPDCQLSSVWVLQVSTTYITCPECGLQSVCRCQAVPGQWWEQCWCGR